ncbi:MAG: regulatory protein RecX [Pyrinomonadaceae bacterium]
MFRKKWKPKTERDETPAEIKDVDKARTRTMQRAVTLLAAKPRSRGELRQRLLEKNWTNAEIVESVLQKLEEYKFLNDEQFAHDFAASKLRQKPQGKRKLQQTLARKQLDKETVETALEQVFEETPEIELVAQAIEKRIRLKGIPANRDETKKFYDYLFRQGFSYGLVSEKMREIAKDSVDEFAE